MKKRKFKTKISSAKLKQIIEDKNRELGKEMIREIHNRIKKDHP